MLQSQNSAIEYGVHYVDFRDVESHCYNIPRAAFDCVRYALPFDGLCTVGPIVEDNSWHNERAETSIYAIEDGHTMAYRNEALWVSLSDEIYQRYCRFQYRIIALAVVQFQFCARSKLIVFDPFPNTLSTVSTLASTTFHIYPLELFLINFVWALMRRV